MGLLHGERETVNRFTAFRPLPPLLHWKKPTRPHPRPWAATSQPLGVCTLFHPVPGWGAA